MMFGPRNSLRLYSLALSALIWTGGAVGNRSASAQSPASIHVDIAPCLEIVEDSVRLACFDRVASAAAPALPRAASAERPAREGAETTTEQESTFATGTVETDVAAAGFANDVSDRPRSREFFSEVASLREILPGKLEITLTNGQVWRQTNSDRYMLQPGHEVRLYTSRFGRYWRLSSTTLRGFVQVERVD